MPKGPNGQKRPADVVGNAVRVMEIATEQRKEYDAAGGSRDMAWTPFIAWRDHAGSQTVRRVWCEPPAQDRPRRLAAAQGKAPR